MTSNKALVCLWYEKDAEAAARFGTDPSAVAASATPTSRRTDHSTALDVPTHAS